MGKTAEKVKLFLLQQALLVPVVRKEIKEKKARRVKSDPQVQMVQLALLVLQAHKVQLAPREVQVEEVLVQLVLQVLQVSKGLLVLKGFRVSKGLPELWVQRVMPVHKEMLGQQVHPVRKELRERKGILV
jgi:hypothetical protein